MVVVVVLCCGGGAAHPLCYCPMAAPKCLQLSLFLSITIMSISLRVPFSLLVCAAINTRLGAGL